MAAETSKLRTLGAGPASNTPEPKRPLNPVPDKVTAYHLPSDRGNGREFLIFDEVEFHNASPRGVTFTIRKTPAPARITVEILVVTE